LRVGQTTFLTSLTDSLPKPISCLPDSDRKNADPQVEPTERIERDDAAQQQQRRGGELGLVGARVDGFDLGIGSHCLHLLDLSGATESTTGHSPDLAKKPAG